MSAVSFDLRAAVLASLTPTLETDPEVLLGWADNLDLVADAYSARGCEVMADIKRRRASVLRRVAAS